MNHIFILPMWTQFNLGIMNTNTVISPYPLFHFPQSPLPTVNHDLEAEEHPFVSSEDDNNSLMLYHSVCIIHVISSHYIDILSYYVIIRKSIRTCYYRYFEREGPHSYTVYYNISSQLFYFIIVAVNLPLCLIYVLSFVVGMLQVYSSNKTSIYKVRYQPCIWYPEWVFEYIPCE